MDGPCLEVRDLVFETPQLLALSSTTPRILGDDTSGLDGGVLWTDIAKIGICVYTFFPRVIDHTLGTI